MNLLKHLVPRVSYIVSFVKLDTVEITDIAWKKGEND